MKDYTNHAGKIKEYNGVSGEIASNIGTYIFTYTSLEDEVYVGDPVIFRVADEKHKVAIDIRSLNKRKSLDEIIMNANNLYEEEHKKYINELKKANK